jgi:hypothetical protein
MRKTESRGILMCIKLPGLGPTCKADLVLYLLFVASFFLFHSCRLGMSILYVRRSYMHVLRRF